MSNLKNNCKASNCFTCPFYDYCIAWEALRKSISKELKTKTNSIYGEIRK